MANNNKIKNTVFSVFTIIIFLLLLEGISNICYQIAVKSPFLALDTSSLFDKTDDLLKKRDIPGYGEVWFSPYFPTRYYSNDVSFAGKIMDYRKSKDTLRIFSYGESSTAGSPWGHAASFSRFLQDELNRIKLKGKIEVMNFGAGGIGSSRILRLVKETIKYEPDVILIYCGHNECYDNYVYLNYLKDRFKRIDNFLLSKFYCVKVGHLIIDRMLPKSPPRQDLLRTNSRPFNQNAKYDKKDRQFLASQYEKNMSEIASIAYGHGSAAVFISQPSNFFYEPEYYSADGDISSMIEKIKENFNGKRYGETVRLIKAVLAKDRMASIAYYYSGLIHLNAKEYNAAKDDFLNSIEFDQKPQRSTEEYGRILKKLENPGKGLFFVDAKSKFYEYLDDGLVDGRLIIDIVHPTIEGQKIIAKSVIEDYFNKYKVRPDIIDYKKYSAQDLWLDNIDPQFYFNVSRRYYDTADIGKCLENAREKLKNGPLQESRISRHVWEFLFYDGLLEISKGNNDAGERLFFESRQVYPSDSLIHLLSLGKR